ncbi:hypothetical protein NE237_004130 [Protea cynaroides]|uniref:Uncharacterized protein n=1 Tax=Protea cynaroides TaxID=273540 RepID=A0A9Q0KIT8_9MAGN|nr:hypothetical protein NE237_004130 [Protea cynaroides]
MLLIADAAVTSSFKSKLLSRFIWFIRSEARSFSEGCKRFNFTNLPLPLPFPPTILLIPPPSRICKDTSETPKILARMAAPLDPEQVRRASPRISPRNSGDPPKIGRLTDSRRFQLSTSRCLCAE